MNIKNWILFQKTFIFATKNWLWGKLLVYQIKKYKKSDFGHFQAFRSTRITTQTLIGHLIFCFQDRKLNFCMKAYLTNLNPRLRGIFDIPTFLYIGIVYPTSMSGSPTSTVNPPHQQIVSLHQQAVKPTSTENPTH